MKLHYLFLVLVLGACDCKTESAADMGMADDATQTDAPDSTTSGPVLTETATLVFDGGDDGADVDAMALSPDGLTLVVTGWGNRVVFFDIASGVGTEHRMYGIGEPTQEHAAVWNGNRVAVGTFRGISIFEADGTLVGDAEGRGNSVAALDDGFVMVGSGGVIFVGPDAVIGRSIELASASRVSFASTGLYVSTDNVDTQLVSLNPDTFAELQRVDWVDWDVYGGGQWNIGISNDRSYLYDGLTEVGLFETNGVAFDAFSVAGAWAAAAGHNEGIVLFDIATRTALASAELDTSRSEAILLDGTDRVFVGTPSGVQIYDIIVQ